MTDEEAAARAINAEPWKPMTGMVKRQCPDCRYWFATRRRTKEQCCPDCAGRANLVPITAGNQ